MSWKMLCASSINGPLDLAILNTNCSGDVLPVCHVDPLYLPPSGPAAYTLPTPAPPSPYFGKRLSVDWDPHYPAPNVYDVPGLVGSGPAKSFGTKVEGGKGMDGHH